MFRSRKPPPSLRLSFPRVRGDVPAACNSANESLMFSPRARGCSAPPRRRFPHATVFPACAGMFLRFVNADWTSGCFPRVRGDVPQGVPGTKDLKRFSPRARGCSHPGQGAVLPALSFPRVRGDVPPSSLLPRSRSPFSPRARGCSVPGRPAPAPLRVFPACAGMFRHQTRLAANPNRFPRVRGDVPSLPTSSFPFWRFSRVRGDVPQTWGF